MSDLFQGQTMTFGYTFVSAGTAHTFTFPFQVDRVTFYNYSKYGTSNNFVQSTWFRGMPDGDAMQIGVGTAPAAKIALETTNGFTVANLPGGAPAYRALISGITAANPVVVTTSAPHGFQTNQYARFTDLGDCGVINRGMQQLDGNRYGIIVLSSTTFSLYDIITGLPLDGTNFEAYVSGGRVDIESRVISLNNPQQPPYQVTPYTPNPFVYNPVTYQLTAGTAVMGADGDIFYIDAIKFGTYTDLGDFLV